MNAAAILPGRDGVRLPNRTKCPDRRHASHGGRPYKKEMREMVIQIWQNAGGGDAGLEALKAPHFQMLRDDHKIPHMDTCKRWIRIWNEEGHVLPKRATGNKHSEREIQGVDLVHLALFRLVKPNAYIDEVRAYLNNRNPTVMPYSRSQIVCAEQRLGLWRKVASSTSNEAYRPVNLTRRRDYWSQSYPVGVNDQDTRDMIDIDEARFKLEDKDRKRGKVTKQKRADARGMYKKGAKGTNLLMGISGDAQHPFEFHRRMYRRGAQISIDSIASWKISLSGWMTRQDFLFHDGQLEHSQAPDGA